MTDGRDEVSTLAEWTGRSTSIGEVLRQLTDLRRQAQRRAASRTSVVTLVVMATSAVDAWDALATVHRFGGRHPARSIVVVADPTATPRLDARVSLTEASAAGHGVWFEDIVLSVAGPAAEHLASLLEPFTLPDLPVAVWYAGGPPSVDDDLLRAADAVIVDSKVAVTDEDGDGEADPDRIAAIAALFGEHTVIDLAWHRLGPWRRLLAGLFEASSARAHLGALTSVEVAGKPGPRALLGGWLASSLTIGPGRLHLSDARHASITLRSSLDGVAGEFRVERVDGRRQVRASATIANGLHASDVQGLPDADLSWSLAEALGALRRDPTYEAALATAAKLAVRT